jgi:hypothetical protein
MKLIVSVLIVISCVLSTGLAKADSAAVKAATEATLTWVSRLDTTQYDTAWSTAAALFKNAVSLNQWTQSISAVRSPLGKPLDRQLQSAEFKTSLPGAPDGQYVVIQFRTRFEHKKDATETVVPMLDKDGQWRVSGYFIR